MSSIRVNGTGYNPIDIAISGMRNHGKRLENITSGVASIGTVDEGAASGTGISPAGRADLVTLDNLPVQMINMNKATRAYEANVAVMKRYERMVNTTLELLQ